MATFPVVLDACVLYPACLRDTLLYIAQLGLYRPHWSPLILDETTRNLIQDGRVSADSADRLVGAMNREFPEASVDVPQAQIEAMPVDPKDRHVAAVAVVANAKVIVTTNLRDFPNEALAPWFIVAQHPDTFLLHEYDLHPEGVFKALCLQAGNLRRPPLRRQKVLSNLSVFAPTFVDRVRTDFASKLDEE